MKNRNLFIIICGALIASIFYCFYQTRQCPSLSDSSNSGTIIVGTNANFPPFEYKENGVIKGFDIDLMEAVGKELGKKIVFKDIPFDSLLIEAQSGRIHVIASALTPTVERSKKLAFTKLYLAGDPIIAITLAAEKPHTINDLMGKEVIVNDGYTAESFMEQHKGIMLKHLATPAESFLALTGGRAYAYVSACSAVQPFFNKYGAEKFSILTLDGSDSYALAVPHACPALFRALDDALGVLETKGIVQSLKEKWGLNF